ncbi:MAG: TolC family protein [Burkholderiales bacterium]
MAALSKACVILAISLTLGGCASLKPEPLSRQALAAVNRADQAALRQAVVPLEGPLTLEAAIARAIKYNAERRVRRMEECVALSGLDVANQDLLPRLVASAGYRDRSNDLLTLSQDLTTGNVIGGRTISSSREATQLDLSFSWSLLDFGQSYYAAKQGADRYLIATERSRRALQILVQDVRTVYWRVAAAQALTGELKEATRAAEQALADARKIEAEGLRSPLEPLRYQRQLLENLRLLELVGQELSSARIELAQLINAPRGQAIAVAEPAAQLAQGWLAVPVEQLEEYALTQNAELRESAYNARIARLETRRAMLRLFPGLSFNYAVRQSDDSYLINQSWNETGLQLSFNLLGLFSARAQQQLAEAGVLLADQKRMSTQMAVLSQLHLARLQYANAIQQYERADSIAQVDARIARHVANQEAAARGTLLERVAQQTASILSQLRRYQALSNAQAAGSKLQATLGLEPPLKAPEAMALPALTEAVAAALKRWDAAALPQEPTAQGEGGESAPPAAPAETPITPSR